MQTLNYTIGNWHAEARVSQVETGKLLAVISVTDASGEETDSRHTVVFEHEEGGDSRAETKQVVQRILQERYGV